VRTGWTPGALRVTGLSLALVLVFSLGGCAQRVRALKEAHRQETAAVQALDPTDILAGRDPVAVLEDGLPQARCILRTNGVLSLTDLPIQIAAAVYRPQDGTLHLTELQDYPASTGATAGRHRWEIRFRPAEARFSIMPPDPFANNDCWDLSVRCADGACLSVARTRPGKPDGMPEPDRWWTLHFDRRDLALDSYAALRVLSSGP